MDKKTLSKICLVCVLTMAAGSAYGASVINGTTAQGTSGTFSTSSNVTIEVKSTSASYAATSQHLSGDRLMFTNSTNPAFYYTTKAKGSTSTYITSETQTAPTTWSSL